ncbi:MAG: hypothetical protein LQ339_007113 [Xanthoria mediterranea]|nr:MAG: hypothetical protein LQ339_007113 [Xanthoria mediterranea]
MAATVARFHHDDLIAFSPKPPGADQYIPPSPTESDGNLITFSPASRLPSARKKCPWETGLQSPGHGPTLFASPVAARSGSNAAEGIPQTSPT